MDYLDQLFTCCCLPNNCTVDDNSTHSKQVLDNSVPPKQQFDKHIKNTFKDSTNATKSLIDNDYNKQNKQNEYPTLTTLNKQDFNPFKFPIYY